MPSSSKILVAITALAVSAGFAAAQCTREQLMATAELYVTAQATGKTEELAKQFAAGVTFRQNNNATTLAASLLGSKTLVIDHNRTIADPEACASYTELIAASGPYVVGTQIRHAANGTGGVTLVDAIVATTGDWGFNASATLRYVAAEDWSTLAAAQRTSRADLTAAADAYLDMWSDTTAIDRVPWGSPCARTEGGMHASPSCKAGVPTTGSAAMKVTDRRYVIDETVGSIDVLNAFAGALPDSHEFRLVNNKLVLVHTITV